MLRTSTLAALALATITVVATGCGRKAAVAEDAPAATSSATKTTSAAIPAAPSGAGAKVGAVSLSELSLDHTKEMDKLLAPLGFKQIMGCGQATMVGRAVFCTYGERPVTVRLEKKTAPKITGTSAKLGPYTLANAVAASDGGTYLLVSTGLEGKPEDSKAVLDAIWDAKAKTVAGVKLASLKDARELEKALATKGFTGDVSSSSGTVEFALRRAVVSFHTNDEIEPSGTFFKEGTATWLGVRLESRNSGDPSTEKRLLDALLGR